MNRSEHIKSAEQKKLFDSLVSLHANLDLGFSEVFDRSLPFADTILDRWTRAKKLGFGAESSIYDSAMVLGKIEVGKHVWVGPNTMLDGSGGLAVGDYCTISAGVHIYSHDNVMQTLSSGKMPIVRTPVSIGHNVYIGPNTIIAKGVSIGNFCVIGAGSFVNKNIGNNEVVVGQPAKVIGHVIFEEDVPTIVYQKK